jgi:hypothetical protein
LDKPVKMLERIALTKCTALANAKLCRVCKTVGEELPTRRCPQCGRKETMVGLLEPWTVEFLLSVALGRQPKNLTIHQMTEMARMEAIQTELIKSNYNYSEVARVMGCHRNTVRRVVGAKYLRRRTADGVAA